SPLEQELSDVDHRLRQMVSPAIARRRAELAARHRALGVQLRDARNEFFALGKVFDQIEYAGRACLPALDGDHTDLLYQRNAQQAESVRAFWPIKTALREAERELRG